MSRLAGPFPEKANQQVIDAKIREFLNARRNGIRRACNDSDHISASCIRRLA